jgi:protein-tyrosine phosphatase
MAQALLGHRLRERLGAKQAEEAFEVTSAGTHGLTSSPMEPAAVESLLSLGVEAGPFEARELGADQVEAADLVLAASREHRAAAVTLVPAASSRTFTLRELARLGSAAVADEETETLDNLADRARRRVAAALASRGYVRAESPADDDVADPYRRSAREFQEAAEEISAAVDAIVDLLVGT